jgi:hypothetical protein
MKTRISLLVLAGVLCLGIQQAIAMGSLVRVTKKNQADNGLKFTLTAEKLNAEVVSVQIVIPSEGKLKNVRSVSISLGSGNGSPQLHAPLQVTPDKSGAVTGMFQLSPELAEKCSIDLVTPMTGRTYTVYSIELKGYVVERK